MPDAHMVITSIHKNSKLAIRSGIPTSDVPVAPLAMRHKPEAILNPGLLAALTFHLKNLPARLFG